MGTHFAGSRPHLRSVVLAAGFAFSTGCAICTSNDGLSPKQWDARERSVASERLPQARDLLAKLGDSTLAVMRPKSTVMEVGSALDESFWLGGVFGMGGPYYAHSCIAAFDSPSYFNLQRDYLWATPDSLILGTVSSSATASTDGRTRPQPTRLGTNRAAIALARLTEVSFHPQADSGVLLFSYSERKAIGARALVVPAGRDSAARTFVSYLRERAGLSALRGR
jgi:hypothetical protein